MIEFCFLKDLLLKLPNINPNSSMKIMGKYLNLFEVFQLDEESLKEIFENSKIAKSLFEFFNKSVNKDFEDDIFEDKIIKKTKKK
jgi:hypothetical protein